MKAQIYFEKSDRATGESLGYKFMAFVECGDRDWMDVSTARPYCASEVAHSERPRCRFLSRQDCVSALVL